MLPGRAGEIAAQHHTNVSCLLLGIFDQQCAPHG